MSPPRDRVKSGRASLFGGVAVGAACFVLWAAIAHEAGAATMPWLAVGAALSAAVATWIRAADL